MTSCVGVDHLMIPIPKLNVRTRDRDTDKPAPRIDYQETMNDIQFRSTGDGRLPTTTSCLNSNSRSNNRSNMNSITCSIRKRVVSETDDVPYQSSKRAATAVCNVTAKMKPTPVFLKKLYHMLEEDGEISKIVTWSPDGTYFIIHSIQAFSKKVLPKYFESSLSSFRRQLHYYGFQKLSDAPLLIQQKKSNQSLIYQHEDKKFCSGRPDLLRQIRRTTRSADPKVEAHELKQTVRSLESEVSTLQQQLDEMREKMNGFEQFVATHKVMSVQKQVSVLHVDLEPRCSNSHGGVSRLGTGDSASSTHWSMLKEALMDDSNNVSCFAEKLMRASSILSGCEMLEPRRPACVENDEADNIDYEAVFQVGV